MNGSPNMQITPDVNQALANANIPLSPALTQYFQQNVTPYLDQLQYQMYQTQVSLCFCSSILNPSSKKNTN